MTRPHSGHVAAGEAAALPTPTASGRAWSAWALLGLGLALSVLAAALVKLGIENDAVKQFAISCDQVRTRVDERLGAHALILRGGAGLFAATETVSRRDWRGYVEQLRTDNSVPGVQGIGYAELIPAERLAAHTARIRAEGFPQYDVRPAGLRPLYTAIIYLEPFLDRNLRAFGYDMYAEPVRRAAMDQARDTGEAALSGKVELVQETGKEVQAGTLMYVPVYRRGAIVDTLEQKRAALAGWTYSPYRMNDLMAGILSAWDGSEGKEVDLHIHDGLVATPASLLFDSKPGQHIELDTLFHEQRMVDFNGHRWLLLFDRNVAASSISYAPAWYVLIGGAALAGLLFWLRLTLLSTRANAVRLAVDLTERISERAVQLDAIFELSPDGFIAFDAEHRIKYLSPAASSLTGFVESELLGVDEADFSLRLGDVCLPGSRFPGLAALREMQDAESAAGAGRDTGGAGGKRRLTIELAGADKRVLEVGLRLAQGATVSQILYFRDITHEAEVDRLKSEFISTAAHELRTPMSSVYGFTELLLSQEFSAAEQREFLETIFRQSELMVSIINEILDLARIEAQRGKDFSLARVDLHLLLAEIVFGFKPPGERHSPLLPEGQAPLWLKVDSKKLTQAVGNVLSNAYKYSPEGGAIAIDLIPPAAGGSRVGIRISDQGIGMTPEQLSRVFERFYRADASGQIPGTGLGMSIVREIVELHGGEVTVDSTFGAGTRVTLWLPGAGNAPADSQAATATA